MKLTTKVCCKCKDEKDQSKFSKDKKSKDGFSYCCKLCTTKKSKEWRENNPERAKQLLANWYKNNLEKVKNDSAVYKKNNSIRRKETGAIRYKNKSKELRGVQNQHTEKISDYYCRSQLRLTKDQAPPELIELKRAQLQLTREIRNQTHGNN